MPYSDAGDWQRANYYDAHEWNLDKSVKPQTMVRGIMGKTTAGAWEYLSAAGNRLMVSGTFTATTSPLSADSSSVSAIQEGANRLRISALQGDGALLRTSGLSPDAGTFRVSAIGGTAGDNVLVDGTDQALSATIQRISGTVSAGANALVAYIQNRDSAANVRISGFSNDAGTFLISAKQGDAGLLLVSAKSDSAGQARISAFSDSGATFRVSAFSNDGALLRVSANLFGDTTGTLTVFQSISVSASQNVKATAGSIYGYYAWNNDTKTNYIKLYNVSGGINLGTDTPIATIAIPASAAGNMEWTRGLKGFTNGIGIAATSGAPIDNTAAPGASAVGIDLFYI